MLTMENNRLTKTILLWDCFINETYNVKTWSAEISDIFKICNLSILFETKQIFHLKDIIYQMKQSLYKNQTDYLKVECQNKPKLRTFISFKDFYKTPSYLTQSLNFHNRRQLAMLRLGCLPLKIELGRHRIPKIPENQRFCKLCGDKNLVESEYHLLFICEAYNLERQNWLSKLTLPINF